MRYAKTFLATFSIAFALAAAVDSLKQDRATDPTTSTITYDDGTKVTVRRPGYPDVV